MTKDDTLNNNTQYTKIVTGVPASGQAHDRHLQPPIITIRIVILRYSTSTGNDLDRSNNDLDCYFSVNHNVRSLFY